MLLQVSLVSEHITELAILIASDTHNMIVISVAEDRVVCLLFALHAMHACMQEP
jgi:hypothetical protein